MTYRIGVDGGGTSTRAVIIDGTHNLVFSRGQSGSSNLYNLGLEGALSNIARAVDDALGQAGMLVGQIESFGFGLAGIVGAREKDVWTRALSQKYGAQIVVDEDVAAALVGSFGADELKERGGAVLIAGTGANCFGCNIRGKRARADGWGPVLGDRGSGFWLGEAAIRAAVASLDGAMAPTPLSAALLEHFAARDLDELVGIIYARDFARERIAAFVPHVLEAARAHDPIAGSLLLQCASHLANTARAVLGSLGVSRLALVGGLLDNVPEIRELLAEDLASIELVEPRFEPVVGAALLAQLG